MRKISILLLLMVGLINLEASAKWFQQKTIFSKALQQDKTYYVGLPTGYNESDTLTRYKVIIFLHGASVTATDIVNSIEPILDNPFSRLFFDKLFKVIFVIPDGSCEPFKGSFYTNSALYGNYEDFIASDIMAEIRSKFHTFKSRDKWSILGHSMGGYGAMKIALKNPEKFIGVSALSGPLNITYFDELLPILLSEHGSAAPYDFTYSGDVTQLMYTMAGAFSPDPAAAPPVQFPVNQDGTINPVVKEKWEANNPINLIRKWKGNPAMAIHTYCGELDEFKLVKPNQMFSDTLAKYKLPHTYYQDPLGDHVNSLATSLPQGINFLYQVMDTAQFMNVTQVKNLKAEKVPVLYPNPAVDRFFVSDVSEDVANIVISNISGQTVIQSRNPVLYEGIDISRLGRGVYLVSLQERNGKISTLRLIKN